MGDRAYLELTVEKKLTLEDFVDASDLVVVRNERGSKWVTLADAAYSGSLDMLEELANTMTPFKGYHTAGESYHACKFYSLGDGYLRIILVEDKICMNPIEIFFNTTDGYEINIHDLVENFINIETYDNWEECVQAGQRKKPKVLVLEHEV